MTTVIWQEAHPGNYDQGRAGVKVDRIVLHVADGTLRGTAAWFADPACPVSAHYTVGMDGTVIQSVSTDNTAWHSGKLDMNRRSVGIEHEGQPSKGPWTPSTLQLAASARLVSDLCERYAIPVDREHIIGHSDVDPTRAARKNCPGPTWPWDAFLMQVRAVRAFPPLAPGHTADGNEQQPVRLFDPLTNKEIGTGTRIEGTTKVYLPEALAARLR